MSNSLRVRCLLCGQILDCDQQNTSNLIEHIRESHPEIKLKVSSHDRITDYVNNLRISASDIALKISSKVMSGVKTNDAEIPKECSSVSIEKRSKFNDDLKSESLMAATDYATKHKRFGSMSLNIVKNSSDKLDEIIECCCCPNECICCKNIKDDDCKSIFEAIDSKKNLVEHVEEMPKNITDENSNSNSNQNENLNHKNIRRGIRVIDRHQPDKLIIKPIDEPTNPTIINDSTTNPTIINDSTTNLTRAALDSRIIYRRKYVVKKPFTNQSPHKLKLYKTSLEKWRPGKGRICCPKCGLLRTPLIRSQVEKSSTSPLGAVCILTCWPFCFLPCLFPPQAKEYLYCSICNNFLGIYDRKTECIQPCECKTADEPVESVEPVEPPIDNIDDTRKPDAANCNLLNGCKIFK